MLRTRHRRHASETIRETAGLGRMRGNAAERLGQSRRALREILARDPKKSMVHPWNSHDTASVRLFPVLTGDQQMRGSGLPAGSSSGISRPDAVRTRTGVERVAVTSPMTAADSQP